ncbi:bifunctional hydroxymethylpyrimidine kinase/phosphomethylpyrimidine kinase [Neomicrococcus lactis]
MVIPNILSIAGTDPSGGAGIQADLKAFSAHGTYGMSVITAAVAQNTRGVRSFVSLDAAFVYDQIAAVFEDIRVDAVKIGMVANAEIALAIAKALDRYASCPVVLDPVMVAKSGHHLLDESAVAALRDELIPRSTVVTPNLPEARVLLGLERDIDSLEEMRERVAALRALGPQWLLLKGGHLSGETSLDILHGERTLEFAAPRVTTTNTHGTGCTLSASIAALLPQTGGAPDVVRSVQSAKDYLTEALRHADELTVGGGHGPVHHFYALWNTSTQMNASHETVGAAS